MELCWVTINTEKMEESLRFYTEIAGLDIASRFRPNPETEIAFLGGADDPKVELISGPGGAAKGILKGISIGIRVDSLDDMLERVRGEGIDVISGPVSPSPSTKFFMVSDPNGVTVQFVEETMG